MGRVVLVADGGTLGSVTRHQTGARAYAPPDPRPARAGGFAADVAGGVAAFSPFSRDTAQPRHWAWRMGLGRGPALLLA